MKLTLLSQLNLKEGELVKITLQKEFVPDIPIIGKFYIKDNLEYYAVIQDKIYINSLNGSQANYYQFGDPFKLTRKWVEDVQKLNLLEKRVYNFNKYSYYE